MNPMSQQLVAGILVLQYSHGFNGQRAVLTMSQADRLYGRAWTLAFSLN